MGAIVLLGGVVAACTPPAEESQETETETETGGEPDPCEGIEPGPDIVVNDPADLEPLLGVECIPGTLLVDQGTEPLPDLSGLEELKVVGTLSIRYNLGIESLAGLENLQRVDRLELVGLQNLTSLDKLESLVEAPDIVIDNNDGLSDLMGLDQLVRIDDLELNGNDGMIDLTGLGAVQTLGSLTITEMDGMESFEGVEVLTRIEDNVSVKRNDVLSTLVGTTPMLDRLDSPVEFIDNPMLSNCEIFDWADGIGTKSAIIESENLDEGCE